MGSFRSQDVQAALAFLQRLYEPGDVAAFRRTLLGALPELISTDLAAWIEINPRTRHVSGISEPAGPFEGDFPRLCGHYYHESPLLRTYRRGEGSAVRLSDFVTQRQLHRTGLYAECLKKVSIEYQLTKGLPGPDGLVTFLSLTRSARDFSERDRRLLNLVRPDLNHAYRNAVLFTQTRENLLLMEQGMDVLNRGLILLTATGAVHHITTRARDWLAAYFGDARCGNSALPEPLARWVRGPAGLTAHELPRPRAPLVVERQDGRLFVRLLSRGERAFLVLDEEIRSIRPAALRSLGLSPRESKVLAWVTEGKSNPAIARILGTGTRNVEKHLEHVYQKFGVKTRTAAAARAMAALSRPEG